MEVTIFLDRDLHIRRFTSRIATIFRLQPHDVGRQLTDFSHNIQRASLIDDILAVRNGGKVIEDEVRDRGGTRYFLRILPYRVGNGHGTPADQAIDGVVLTLTDISALTKARERLAQLSAIVESSDDAIAAASLDGTITSWNRGAERLYGYAAETAIGRNLRILTPSGAADELGSYIEQMQRGEHVEHARSLHVHADGRRIDVSVTLSPIHDASGTMTGISAIARDMSPLLAAQREIEEAARRREQFLAMLSHELRNPLAAVMNATAVLQTPADGEARTRAQAVIGRQTAHMQRLLDDLLDVSRITRGKFELRTASLDLRKPLEAAIESTAPLYAERGVRLEHRIPDVVMPVRGDANRLMQVVVNLLSNAANYSPRLTTVQLDVTVDAGRATICVTDHGVGIEPALQDRIFELFVQAEQRLDRSRGGLGVGLSLARSIVELHRGTIAVHSEGSGKGSRFTVTIPLGETARALTDRPSARLLLPRRIVLVDDQDDSREMLRMLLEARDHIVLDAADGPSAIALIERERPDIAFIDIGLPTMTGYEVAQHIRKRADLACVRLVALTGYGNPSDVALAREAGFDEHVIKPAELARLEQILAGAN